MEFQIPDFTTQMRGFDRAEVVEYVTRLQRKTEILELKLTDFEKAVADAGADRERLAAQVGELQTNIEQTVAQAESDRRELTTRITELQNDLERAPGPAASVEEMSDRIARMMRIASDEARRAKELAQQEAAALTRELREQVQAASADRIAANEALAEFQASNNARREKILATAVADAEEILRVAHQERDRLVAEIEEAERSRRELYLRLAEEDERKRREAQEALDEQIKSAWEDDVRNRQEAQHRMEQRITSSWDEAGKRIAELDQEARLKASDVLTVAQREADLLTERTRAEVNRLHKERSEIVNGLNEIRHWIETAVDSGQIGTVAAVAVADGAEQEEYDQAEAE